MFTNQGQNQHLNNQRHWQYGFLTFQRLNIEKTNLSSKSVWLPSSVRRETLLLNNQLYRTLFWNLKRGETLAYAAGRFNNFLFDEYGFSISLFRPAFLIVGCWNNDMPVPLKEPSAVIDLGLLYILSRAAVVKTFDFNARGQTTCVVLYWVKTLFPMVTLTTP